MYPGTCIYKNLLVHKRHAQQAIPVTFQPLHIITTTALSHLESPPGIMTLFIPMPLMLTDISLTHPSTHPSLIHPDRQICELCDALKNEQRQVSKRSKQLGIEAADGPWMARGTVLQERTVLLSRQTQTNILIRRITPHLIPFPCRYPSFVYFITMVPNICTSQHVKAIKFYQRGPYISNPDHSLLKRAPAFSFPS